MNRLEDWKRQLEQADEYGLFFDKSTVREMIELIEKQQAENEQIKIVSKEEVDKLKDFYENLLADERLKNRLSLSESVEKAGKILRGFKLKWKNTERNQ